MGRLALAIVVALSTYLVVYRPLQINWGATEAEVSRPKPGDEIVPRPTFNATRAVTINATPEEIWPWLVQIGHTRAGWYGYDLIDNLAKPSAEQIVPELQHLQVGDLFPMSPDGKLGLLVREIEAGRWMLWGDEEGRTNWLWALEPTEESRTRLITRVRMKYAWRSPMILFDLAIDLGDFVMRRECMRGIKSRAEGQSARSLLDMSTELFLWIAAFACFAIAELRIITRQDWRRPLVVAVAAALITILVVLWQPPLWIDALAAVIVLTGLRWASRDNPSIRRKERNRA
jgi:hypothetical protein